MDTASLDMAQTRESQIRAALSAILASPVFQASPGLGRLLTFLVEEDLSNHRENLKETYIGHILYGRPATYDPKLDSVVRVNANRLRGRLLEYYAENRTVSPRIIIRPGSYIPIYEFDPESTPFEETKNQQPKMTVQNKPVSVEIDGHANENGEALPPGPIEEFSSAERDTQRYWTHTIPFAEGKLVPSSSVPESPQNQIAPPTTWSVRRWTFLVVCILFAGTIVGIILSLSERKTHRSTEWRAEPFSSLDGQEEFAAISPDGLQLAFSWTTRSAPSHIFIQALDERSPKRLTSGDDEESRPTWSPDGKSIAFLHVLASGGREVMLKSLSNGNEVKVAELHGSYPWLCTIPRLSWAPDGKKIYTSGSIGTPETCSVVAIDVATGNLEPITQSPLGSIGDLEPAVSPDGKQVAFLRNAGTLGGDIYVTTNEGGGTRRVTFDNRDIMGFCWMADSSGFIVSSRRGDGVPRLWQLSLNGKLAKPLTDGLTLAAFPSISPQGDRIAFTAYRTTASIRQVSNGLEKLLISDQSSNSTPHLSPDGKSLVYRSDRTGSFELWISKLDGQNGTQLTHFKGPMVNNPRWSPDGKWVVFECRPQGQSSICLVNPSDLSQTHVLNHWTSNEIFPSWSSDGHSIYFTSNYSGQWEIYCQAIAGGDPVAVTHDGGKRALQSADGHWLYIFRGEGAADIVRIPTPDRLNLPMEVNKSAKTISRFGPDMDGRWDITQNGLMYLLPPTSSKSPDLDGKERVVAIDGNTMVQQNIGSVTGPSPAGDLIFSAEAGSKSFLYVKQGLKEGDIGFLLLESVRR